LRFAKNIVRETSTPGMAGTNLYRIVTVEGDDEKEVTTYGICPSCTLCGHNGLLQVQPRLYTDSNFHGYVVPMLRRITVASGRERLLPIPFAANIVPFEHQRSQPLYGGAPSRRDAFNLGLGDGWTSHLTTLLRLVPDLSPDEPFDLHHRGGRYTDTPQGWESNEGAKEWARHGFTTVVYGRERLEELGATTIPPDTTSILSARRPVDTNGLGMAEIVDGSRNTVGSLPPNDSLWRIWSAVAGREDDIEQYHERILTIMD
jgi:hypothetical protein